MKDQWEPVPCFQCGKPIERMEDSMDVIEVKKPPPLRNLTPDAILVLDTEERRGHIIHRNCLTAWANAPGSF